MNATLLLRSRYFVDPPAYLSPPITRHHCFNVSLPLPPSKLITCRIILRSALFPSTAISRLYSSVAVATLAFFSPLIRDDRVLACTGSACRDNGEVCHPQVVRNASSSFTRPREDAPVITGAADVLTNAKRTDRHICPRLRWESSTRRSRVSPPLCTHNAGDL
ncbi:hypothetical protein DFH09DRAFT_1340748 [Mycena vulgaris]|nr:hypothetical protein DFH09DRAFT_1342898 [Mycena vulgaris]KAJ6482400.1 hypothetical protein DFH09DRAFT_1340748 [Mycena vulgaris]